MTEPLRLNVDLHEWNDIHRERDELRQALLTQAMARAAAKAVVECALLANACEHVRVLADLLDRANPTHISAGDGRTPGFRPHQR